MPTTETLSYADAADRYAISRGELQDLVRRRVIGSTRRGHQPLLDVASLEAHLVRVRGRDRVPTRTEIDDDHSERLQRKWGLEVSAWEAIEEARSQIPGLRAARRHATDRTTPFDTSDRRSRTAVHEAGHGHVARALGHTGVVVKLHPETDAGGVTTSTPPAHETSYGRAVLLAAGTIAERIPGRHALSIKDEQAIAAEILTWGSRVNPGGAYANADDAQLARLAAQATPTEWVSPIGQRDFEAGWLAGVVDDCDNLLRRDWQSVLVTAQLILESGEVKL